MIRRMVKPLLASLPLLVFASAFACGPTLVEPCPAGWTSAESGYYCTPPTGSVDAFRTQLGTGVFGFVRETHWIVDPKPAHTTSVLMAGVQVQLVPSSTPAPPVSSTCTLSPNPVASVVTDAQGVFAISAPPGDYRLESCTKTVTVTVPADVIEQDLDFNDVPQ
jgi:hypothetical protein